MKVLSLFDGISAGYMALEKLGIDFEYYAVEIDKYPRVVSDHNFPKIKRFENDVTKITEEQLQEYGSFDIMFFGFPCQAYSVAGTQGGLDADPLLYHAVRIRDYLLKLNPKMLWFAENVKMKGKLLEACNQVLGTTPTLINSALVSGQRRERNYWSNFPITQPEDKGILLKDVLESVVPKDMWVYPKGAFKLSDSRVIWGKSIQDRAHPVEGKSTCLVGDGRTNKNLIYFRKYVESENRQICFAFSSSIREGGVKEHRSKVEDKAHTLTTGDGCCGGLKSLTGVADIQQNNLVFRKLTVRECARLQTMPDSLDFSPVSKTQAYKAIGNSWTVDVITHILKCGFEFEEEKDL